MSLPVETHMNRILAFFFLNLRRAWIILGCITLVLAVAVGLSDLSAREQQRLALLETEAQRSGLEIMSQTLNGNLMGSITLLGLIDVDIKQEASNGLLSVDAHIQGTLSTVGNAFDAEGVFVVGTDGIVKTSWDRINKPSTGLNVRFRPYYQSAIRGQSSVYAAVSMARGDRSLYFTAPIYSEHAKATSGIGALVARTNLSRVDSMIKDRFDVALLLSPQGIVFASNRAEWIGLIDGVPTPQRLKAIRDLKQFGAMFERADPVVLPFNSVRGVQRINGGRFAVAAAGVKWNDPSGDWKLLVLEDLARTTPVLPSALKAAMTAVMTLLLGWMLIYLLRSQQAQAQANEQLQVYARQQDANLRYRRQLAEVSARFQHCNSLAELAQLALREARTLLGALQGVLYVADPEVPDLLRLAGSAACADEPPATLVLGEGLLGQCALEQHLRVIATPLDQSWTLRSGLGEARPAALLLAPLVMQDLLIGVLELAVTQEPDANAKERAEDLVALLANSLDNLRRNLQRQQPVGRGVERPGGHS